MPEWVENSTPALTRTDVDPDKPYVPGTADDDDTPAVDFISVELSPSANLTDVPVRPDQRHPDSEPGRQHQRLRGGGLSGRRSPERWR